MVGSATSKQPFLGNNEIISQLILNEFRKNNLNGQINLLKCLYIYFYLTNRHKKKPLRN
jgi:hypothetical protein